MGQHEDVESAEVTESVRESVEPVVGDVQLLQLLTEPLHVCREAWGGGEGGEGGEEGEGGEGGEEGEGGRCTLVCCVALPCLFV